MTTNELMRAFAAELDKIEKGESEWKKPSKSPAQQFEPRPSDVEPPVSTPSGESEWEKPEESGEYNREEELINQMDSDVPNQEEEYRYNPDEKPDYRYHPDELEQPKYTDAEVLKMIEEDPAEVVTNLMLHRFPEYQKIELLLPMAQGMIKWMTDAKISPEEGSLLYEETKKILNTIDQLSKKD